MSEIDYNAIGYRIKHERTSQNLTQAALAELSGLTPNHISHIELGATKLSVKSLINISNALQSTPNELLMDSLDNNEKLLMGDLANVVERLEPSEIVLLSELCRAIMRARTLTGGAEGRR